MHTHTLPHLYVCVIYIVISITLTLFYMCYHDTCFNMTHRRCIRVPCLNAHLLCRICMSVSYYWVTSSYLLLWHIFTSVTMTHRLTWRIQDFQRNMPWCTPTLPHLYVCVILPGHNVPSITGWRRLIGSPNLQIIFHKRATKYRSLLRKMSYKDKGSYESSPPCTLTHLL